MFGTGIVHGGVGAQNETSSGRFVDGKDEVRRRIVCRADGGHTVFERDASSIFKRGLLHDFSTFGVDVGRLRLIDQRALRRCSDTCTGKSEERNNKEGYFSHGSSKVGDGRQGPTWVTSIAGIDIQEYGTVTRSQRQAERV